MALALAWRKLIIAIVIDVLQAFDTRLQSGDLRLRNDYLTTRLLQPSKSRILFAKLVLDHCSLPQAQTE